MPRKENVKKGGITDFGKYFHDIRRILGIRSLLRIAQESGIPQTTLWTWENDGNRPESLERLDELFVAMRKYKEWRPEPWERDLTVLAGHTPAQLYRQALSNLAELESEVKDL